MINIHSYSTRYRVGDSNYDNTDFDEESRPPSTPSVVGTINKFPQKGLLTVPKGSGTTLSQWFFVLGTTVVR